MIGLFKLILLCLVAISVQAADNKSPEGNNFCQGCKSIVSFTRTLNASYERDEFRDLLANFCNQYYPPSTDLQGPCPMFVEGFFAILARIDPVFHCDTIGACDSPITTDSFETIFDKSSLTQLSRTDDVVCEFCEQLVKQAQTMLTDPRSIDLIERQLDAFCDYLQIIEQDKECRQLERKYLKQAIDFIKTINPKQYCHSIQLCRATSSGPRQHQDIRVAKKLPTLTDFADFGIETSVVIGDRSIGVEQDNKSKNEVILKPSATNHKDGSNCLICKAVIKETFHFIRENKTEENIMIGLDRVCKILYRHEPSLGQCYSMVKAYTKEIIQLLIDETDPEMICMMLGQCTYEPEPLKIQDQTNKSNQQMFGLSELITALDPSIELKSTRSCVECKLFIKYLKDTIDNPTSQEYLKNWLLKHLCADLSHNLSGSCTEMVNEYSAIFFKAVVGTIDPKTACAELDVCPRQQFHEVLVIDNDPSLLPPPPYRPRLTQQQTKNNVLLQAAKKTESNAIQIGAQICDQCVDIITQIDAYLSTHSIDGDVSVLIDKVCNNMPEGVMRNECTLVVREFGSSLVRMIAEMKNPREVCSKIYLC